MLAIHAYTNALKSARGPMIGQHMKEHGENTARVDGCFKASTEKMSKQVRVSVV